MALDIINRLNKKKSNPEQGRNDDINTKEAIEHADYNILGSQGEHFPIYIRRKNKFYED